MQLQLIVADPRATARASLSTLVKEWDWRVVAEAADGLEAVRLCRELKPDVLLIDSSAGGLDVASIYEYMEPETGPLVVRLLNRPQDHAIGQGLAILKGVPAARVREVVQKELAARSSVREQAST